MKYLLLTLVSIGFISCGAPVEEPTADAQMGRDWALTVDEKFSATDLVMVKSICTSLGAKNTFFKNVYVDEGPILKYSLGSNDCSTDDISNNGTVQMSVAQSGGGLVLNNADGVAHISDILTNKSDSIEDLCDSALAAGASNINLYEKDDDVINWFRIGASTASACNTSAGEVCFTIFTGYKNTDNKDYKIKDINEFYISVSSTPSRNGLVTYRTKKSSHACSEKDQFRTKTQTFSGTTL
jgi:hypothetical protein